MNETDVQGFASMVCAYSFFEYGVKRVVLTPHNDLPVKMRQVWKESALLFLVMLVGTAAFLSLQIILCWAALAVVHALYEFFSQKARGEEAKKKLLERYVVRQILMGLLLYTAWRCAVPMQLQESYIRGQRWMFGGSSFLSSWLEQHCVAILVILSAYLSMIDGGTKIIRGILDKFPNLYNKVMESLQDQSDGDSNVCTGVMEEENAGEWIGILERIITLTFVLTGSFTAIAFALTAKSIGRFKELGDKHFAEYYLLGTSASVASALIVGMIVKIILGI